MNKKQSLNEKICEDTFFEGKDRLSNTTNDSQTFGLSVCSDQGRDVQMGVVFENNLFYKKYFEERVKQPEISANLHKKAINWLITFCWTRSYSEQILWYSVGYYYSYFYSNVIKKQRLTLILISAVNLSLKLFQSDSIMSFENMKNSLSNTWLITDLQQTEKQLIELFQFDLYFPTVLNQILMMKIPDEEKFKILFIAQSMFMNGFQAALNEIVLEDIQLLISKPENVQDLKSQIKKLAKQSKFIDIIKQKYSSKFNVEQFLNHIFKEY